jgi:hypothetical protein
VCWEPVVISAQEEEEEGVQYTSGQGLGVGGRSYLPSWPLSRKEEDTQHTQSSGRRYHMVWKGTKWRVNRVRVRPGSGGVTMQVWWVSRFFGLHSFS